MSKPKPDLESHTGPMLAIGTKVSVLRPNLWFGSVGEVTKHDGAKHWVKIMSKDGDGYFNCVATLDELKEIKK